MSHEDQEPDKGEQARPNGDGFGHIKPQREPWLTTILAAIGSIKWGDLLTTLRNRILAGVIIAIPIIVTIWVMQLAFDFIKGVSEPWVFRLTGHKPPDTVSFVITLLALLGLGFMATNVFGAKVIEGLEKFALSIPGVSTIFSASKQVIEAFKGISRPSSFQRVVYIQYPSEGCRLLAFVTGQFMDHGRNKEVTSVFLPTSPNPITGFVLIVDSDKVTDSQMSMEEAMKLVVSGGLVTPRKRDQDSSLPGLVVAGGLLETLSVINPPAPSSGKE
jgi:uncharacterized membrane protein